MGKASRKLLLFVALFFIMITVGACGNRKEAEEVNNINEQNQEPIGECSLYVVTMMGGDDSNGENYQAVIEQFNKDYPQVTIEDESVSSNNDWKVQMEADFAMDREPDVFQYFTDANAANILKTDKFVPLSEIQAEDPRIAANVSKESLEQTKSPLDGVNYAIPTSGYWEGLFCNKDLFDQYGLELPTTWDKLMKAVKVFRKNGITPISVALNDIPNYWIENLILTASTIEEYTTVPNKAPQAWAKGLSRLKELYDAGAFCDNAITIDNEMAGEMFRTKRSAMQLDGSWYLNRITDQENTVVCAFPAWEGARIEKGTAIQGYSSGFYITRKAWADPDKRKAALAFVYANTRDEQLIRYWDGAGICSVPVPENISYTNLQKSGAIYAASISNPVSPIDSRVTPEAFNELKNRAVAIATGKIDAMEAIKAMLLTNKQLGL